MIRRVASFPRRRAGISGGGRHRCRRRARIDERGEHRLLVTRFAKGDYIMRKGVAATFLAVLLQGELGVRIGKGGGFPRRLHKGALFGERAMFSAEPFDRSGRRVENHEPWRA